ncbi:MAG: hypothetical protein GEU80_11115 [Dehalococcoidia bacterium]|nr:hypothetical protein [Dehalococcoidia bacterium]
MSVIDSYLATLRRALRLDRAYRDRVIEEARDHLETAAEALQGEGLERYHAEIVAVARFGDARSVARRYSASPRRVVAEAYVVAAMLVGAGLLVIGLSGAFSLVFATTFGDEFVSRGGGSIVEDEVGYSAVAGIAGALIFGLHWAAHRWLLGAGPRDLRWLTVAAVASGAAFALVALLFAPLAVNALWDGALFGGALKLPGPPIVSGWWNGSGVWVGRLLACLVGAWAAFAIAWRGRHELLPED